MPPRRRSFGPYLRKEREAHQLTQRQLAKKVGTSATNIVNLEQGFHEPRVSTLAALGTLFGWDFNRTMEFFGAQLLDNPDRLGSEIALRPPLLRLFRAARALKNSELDFIADVAETRGRTLPAEKDQEKR